MRNLHEAEVDRFRVRSGPIVDHYGSIGDETCGAFLVPSPIDRSPIRVIASAGSGWDHVSISRPTRCPNWPEMEHIKRLFFREDETAMQLHVPTAKHISNHDFCLHLWRPHVAIPLPPEIFV